MCVQACEGECEQVRGADLTWGCEGCVLGWQCLCGDGCVKGKCGGWGCVCMRGRVRGKREQVSPGAIGGAVHGQACVYVCVWSVCGEAWGCEGQCCGYEGGRSHLEL